MSTSLELLPDVLGLVSGLVLLRPAFRLNALAKVVWRLGRVEFDSRDDPFLEQERKRLAERFAQRRAAWNKLDEVCLVGGLATLVLSFLARVLLRASGVA